MLHNEARELLVKGYEKTHKAKEIAQAYSVSEATVYRLAQQKRETGSAALRVNLRGRKRLLSPEAIASIDQAITAQPDITIHEIRETLHLQASEETIRRAVVALGYRYKKKMIHASEQKRPRCAGEATEVGRGRCKD